MLDAFNIAVSNVPVDNVHIEHFAPVEDADKSGDYVVEIASTGKLIPIPVGKTILETLRAEGIQVESSCEEGICGCCEVGVLSGIPDHRDAVLLQSEREANNVMMVCCSGAKSDKLVLDL